MPRNRRPTAQEHVLQTLAADPGRVFTTAELTATYRGAVQPANRRRVITRAVQTLLANGAVTAATHVVPNPDRDPAAVGSPAWEDARLWMTDEVFRQDGVWCRLQHCPPEFDAAHPVTGVRHSPEPPA